MGRGANSRASLPLLQRRKSRLFLGRESKVALQALNSLSEYRDFSTQELNSLFAQDPRFNPRGELDKSLLRALIRKRAMAKHPYLEHQAMLNDYRQRAQSAISEIEAHGLEIVDEPYREKIDRALNKAKAKLRQRTITLAEAKSINSIITSAEAAQLLFQNEVSQKSVLRRPAMQALKAKIQSSVGLYSSAEVIVVPERSIWRNLVFSTKEPATYSAQTELAFISDNHIDCEHTVCHELIHGTQKFHVDLEFPTSEGEVHAVAEKILLEGTTEYLAHTSLGTAPKHNGPYYYAYTMLLRAMLQKDTSRIIELSNTPYGQRCTKLQQIFNKAGINISGQELQQSLANYQQKIQVIVGPKSALLSDRQREKIDNLTRRYQPQREL